MEREEKGQLPKIKYFLDDRVSMRTKNIEGIDCQVEQFELSPVMFEKRLSGDEQVFVCPYIFENDSFGIFNQYKSLEELKTDFAKTVANQVEAHVKDRGTLRELLMSIKLKGEPSTNNPGRGTLILNYGSVAYIPLRPAKETVDWE